MDPFLAKRMQLQEGEQIARRGDTTRINGVSQTVSAIWQQAQPGRVSLFVHEDDWERGVYVVQFTQSVLNAPWSLANGSEVVRVKLNWRTVVRHVDVIESADTNCAVQCICAIVPQ